MKAQSELIRKKLGKIAVITGGHSGIGLATTQRFIEICVCTLIFFTFVSSTVTYDVVTYQFIYLPCYR